MNEGYDVTGRVHKIEQRRTRVSGLEQLRDFESFDVEFSPTGQVIQTVHYKRSGDIDGSERFKYDETGTLISSVSFDGAGLQTNSTEYEYDNEGRRVGWVVRDASGVATRRCVQRYVGELLTSFAMFQINGLAVGEKVFEYAGKSLLKSVSKYYAPNGDLGEQWISHYDSNSRLEETFGLTAEGKPLGDGRYRYEYDADGHTIKTLSFNEWTDENVPNAITIFEYIWDEVGNWIERRKHYRSKSDSDWTIGVTTRKICYYACP